MLKWQGRFQTISFYTKNRHIYTYKKICKEYEMTNKRQFKEEALPVELHADHLDHQVQCPTVQMAMH